jgi:hypothetical protein
MSQRHNNIDDEAKATSGYQLLEIASSIFNFF